MHESDRSDRPLLNPLSHAAQWLFAVKSFFTGYCQCGCPDANFFRRARPEGMADIQVINDVAAAYAGTGKDRRTPDGAGGAGLVTVAVITDDPIAADSVRMYLRSATGIRAVPREQTRSADVVVVVTIIPTEDLLATMHEVQRGAANPGQCMVLVSDPLTDRHLTQAFRYGVVSMIPRRSATPELIVHAVRASGRGSSVLSGSTTRWLADNSRSFREVVMAAHGVTAGGLTVREADVVRLLAEGMSTADIARQLNYAERTIKNVIADMLSRLHLRNRIQAVAYAYRVGAI